MKTRLKPVCLLIISGLDFSYLNGDILSLSKLKDEFPLIPLQSDYSKISEISKSYIELGTGTYNDLEKKSNISLSNVLSLAGMKQLHIAETESYANITYFFNGRNRDKNDQEIWSQIKSPKMDNYLSDSELMTSKINTRLISEIEKKNYDFIVANYDNLLSNFKDDDYRTRSLELLSKKIKVLIDTVLSFNGVLLITSNISFQKKQLPLFLISKQWRNKSFIAYDHFQEISLQKANHRLSDLAPTILKIMQINQKQKIEGESII